MRGNIKQSNFITGPRMIDKSGDNSRKNRWRSREIDVARGHVTMVKLKISQLTNIDSESIFQSIAVHHLSFVIF